MVLRWHWQRVSGSEAVFLGSCEIPQVSCSCTTSALMSAQKHTLPVYIWFWYSIMQNIMSIQEGSIT